MNIPTQPASPRTAFPTWIWWVVAVVVVAGLGVFLFAWRATLDISVDPPSATITAGNVSGVGTLHLAGLPGVYHVRIEASGTIPYTNDLALHRHETKRLHLTLRALPTATKLTDGPVQFLAFDQTRESLLYLVPTSHRIERLFLKDLRKPVIDAITPDRFGGVTELVWSPDRQLTFYREACPEPCRGSDHVKQYDFKRYDLVNQTTTNWPGEVHAIDWRPDGQKVAYVYRNDTTGEDTLIRADKGNDNPERIFNFGGTAITDPAIHWSPDGKTIAIVEHNLFLLDVFSATLKPINVGSFVKDVVWAPGSDRLLYETEGGMLGTVKTDGTKDAANLVGSLDRAVFTGDGKGLIVAKDRGSTLTLSQYDLKSGVLAPYSLAPGSNLNPTNLLLSKDGATLYFTSAGALYALPLDDGRYPAP